MNKFNFIFRLLSKFKKESATNVANKTDNDIIGYTALVPKPGTDIKSIKVYKPKEVLPSGKEVVIKPMYSFFISESKVN